MIALAPVLFIGLVLWLDRGPVGDKVERAAVAVTTAAVLLVLPAKQLVAAYTVHDAMTLIPLYKLLQASSTSTRVAVYVRRGARGGRLRPAPPPCPPGRARSIARRARGRVGRREPLRCRSVARAR
jgi:hypothetical protein